MTLDADGYPPIDGPLVDVLPPDLLATLNANAMRNGSPYSVYKAEERSRPPCRIWTPEEIWAPIDPPIYAVGTLAQGDVAMMCAHGSSLKSWAGIAAVVAKAMGGSWLERFPCSAAPAMYLDNEMGPDECRRRMQRYALASGARGPVAGVSLVSLPGFSLTSSEGIVSIRKLAEGQSLMVIDSLAAFCPDVDENDARFADPLKRMKEIGDAMGCAFMVLHHSRKAKGDGEDDRERPRGTSALFAACDVVLQLSRAHDDGFLVRQTKARKGKAAEDFVLRVQDVDGAEATRVYATPVDEVEADVTETAGSIDTAKARIVRLLGSDRDIRSASEIHRRIRGRKTSNLEAVKELEERHTIVKVAGVYRLTSEVDR